MFKWTTERPTEPGFYWVRHTSWRPRSPVVVELVRDDQDKLRVDCSYVAGLEAEIEISLRDCTAFARVPTPEQVEDFEQRINSALISLRNP
jgi:hypothetical protein